MDSTKLFPALLLSAVSLPGLACEIPSIAVLPDEEQPEEAVIDAFREDMIAYLGGMTEYVTCIQEEHAALSAGEAYPVALRLLVARNNLAIAEIEAMREVYEARVGPIDDLAFGAGRCIRVSRDELDYEILNETSIIVSTGDGSFRNVLTGCPQLHGNTEISFLGLRDRGRTGICADNYVIIEDTDVRCRLGSFEPLTEAEAQELLQAR